MNQRIHGENANVSRKGDANTHMTSENGGWCDKMNTRDIEMPIDK